VTAYLKQKSSIKVTAAAAAWENEIKGEVSVARPIAAWPTFLSNDGGNNLYLIGRSRQLHVKRCGAGAT